MATAKPSTTKPAAGTGIERTLAVAAWVSMSSASHP
jgi:hypothetical protein